MIGGMKLAVDKVDEMLDELLSDFELVLKNIYMVKF